MAIAARPKARKTSPARKSLLPSTSLLSEVLNKMMACAILAFPG
jgi:hypothetical protein